MSLKPPALSETLCTHLYSRGGRVALPGKQHTLELVTCCVTFSYIHQREPKWGAQQMPVIAFSGENKIPESPVVLSQSGMQRTIRVGMLAPRSTFPHKRFQHYSGDCAE